MFDAKSLLEMMVRGAAPNSPQSQPGGAGGLGDLLGQLLGGGTLQGAPSSGGAGNAGGIGGLEDLMRQFGGGGSPASSRAAAPSPNAPPNPPQGAGNPLEDLLRNLTGGQGGAGGSLIDILGQVLGQATSGVKEGAQRVDDATGASGQLRDILTKATGKTPEELMNKAKDLVEKNKVGAGAAAGGLGAVVLGTQTGRALAGSVFKIGALALIGGLAYKAVQNYQAGKPLLGGGSVGGQQALVEAPSGSGFEARAVTNESALLYIRAMIAAAAADGRIDASEQQKIIGGLKQAGLDRQAEEFLANELNNPASTAELAAAARGDAEAVQVFTAARIAIDLDTEEEHDFLVQLANELGLDNQLVGHIDATARQAA